MILLLFKFWLFMKVVIVFIGKLSRPRLCETQIFSSCRDRDSSRLRILQVVETETNRDYKILKLSRPRPIETGKFNGCRDRDWSRLDKSCRDRDFDKTFSENLLKLFKMAVGWHCMISTRLITIRSKPNWMDVVFVFVLYLL